MEVFFLFRTDGFFVSTKCQQTIFIAHYVVDQYLAEIILRRNILCPERKLQSREVKNSLEIERVWIIIG